MRMAMLVVAVCTVGVAACSFQAPVQGDDAFVIPKVGFLDDSSLQDEASGNVLVPVTLDVMPTQRAIVSYSISDGSAKRGEDYEGSNGMLVFEPGEQQQNIMLSIVDDGMEEGDETVILRLSSPEGAELGTAEHTITISANLLPRASITVDTSTGMENANATVAIYLDRPPTTDAILEYSIGGEVTAADYGPVTGTITIPAGQQNAELSVPVVDDALDEFDEDLVVTLTGSPNVIITPTRTRTHAIVDNDAEPTIAFSAANALVAEADGAIELDVALSAPSGKPIEFTFSTTVGTNASLDKDYTYATTGPVMIAAGATTAKVRIAIVADALDEIDETVATNIDTATNATIGATQKNLLSITDDDLEPTVSFQCGGSTAEPLLTSRTIQLKLALSAPSGRTVIVTLVPDEGGNKADEGTGGSDDYSLPSKQISIEPETTTKDFDVVIQPDGANDTPEDIVIDLGAITAATAGSPATCTHTITDPL